jgi:hypothetical protein
MPCVGFEPTITASERAKTVHALDRAATVTGSNLVHHAIQIRKLTYILLFELHIILFFDDVTNFRFHFIRDILSLAWHSAVNRIREFKIPRFTHIGIGF